MEVPPLTLTRDQVREVDRRAIDVYGMPGVVMMENAGRGAAEWLLALTRGTAPPVVICCGRGNNGGDGFVIARHLDNRGLPVKILVFADPEKLSGDAAINYRIVERSHLPVTIFPDTPLVREELDRSEWVVDAMLGTGAHGPPRAPFDQVIALINEQSRNVLAVDIPSGLDCDTGRAEAAVRATHTATFVALKTGFSTAGAAEFLGQVEVIDIGVPRRLVHQIAGTGD